MCIGDSPKPDVTEQAEILSTLTAKYINFACVVLSMHCSDSFCMMRISSLRSVGFKTISFLVVEKFELDEIIFFFAIIASNS